MIEPWEDGAEHGYWVATLGLEFQPLLAAGDLLIDVVAGARFGNYLPPSPAGLAGDPPLPRSTPKTTPQLVALSPRLVISRRPRLAP